MKRTPFFASALILSLPFTALAQSESDFIIEDDILDPSVQNETGEPFIIEDDILDPFVVNDAQGDFVIEDDVLDPIVGDGEPGNVDTDLNELLELMGFIIEDDVVDPDGLEDFLELFRWLQGR